jgi:septal ring factor EnvC (AmiA/AmiB activator)
MSGLSDILLQFAVGAVPLGVAYLAFRSATDANKKTQQTALMQAERQAELERSKVDAEAFLRAKTIYEDALSQMEKQMARVQTQSGQLSADLVNEQSTATAMRDQVRRLQAQIRALERTVIALRAQLVAAGLSPVPVSETTGPYVVGRPPATGPAE